jgi:hypothetical protein
MGGRNVAVGRIAAGPPWPGERQVGAKKRTFAMIDLDVHRAATPLRCDERLLRTNWR